MSDPFVSDNTINAARMALNGLSLREEVIGRNVANVDTPGYQAQQVDFESALGNAIGGGSSLKMAVTDPAHLLPQSQSTGAQVSARPGGSERADGNDVDIQVELAQMTETGVRYEALTDLLSKKLSLLKSIAGGG